MIARRTLVMVVVALAATGAASCGRPFPTRPGAHGQAGTRPHADAPPGIRVAWSDDVRGEVRAITADADGEVVTVNGNEVVALDVDGRVQWSVPLDGASSGRVVLDGDRVIVPISHADGSGGCAGLDRATGETRWNYIAVGTRGVAVAQAGELAICVMRNGQTAAIWPESGFPQWELTFAIDVPSASVQVPDGTAIAVDEHTGYFAFVVHARDWWEVTFRKIATGRGTKILRLGRHGPPSGVIALPGYLVAVSSLGHVFAADIRARDVVPLGLVASGGFDPATAPVVGAGVFVVATRKGNVVGFQFHDPLSRWTVHTRRPMRNPQSVVIDATVIVATSSGRLLGFRMTDGAAVTLPASPGRGILTAPTGDGSSIVIAAQVAGGGRIERWVAGPARAPAAQR